MQTRSRLESIGEIGVFQTERIWPTGFFKDASSRPELIDVDEECTGAKRQRLLMSGHANAFAALPLQSRMEYDLKARRRMHGKEHDIENERSRLTKELADLDKTAAVEAARDGCPNHVSACSFDAADIETLCDALNSTAYSNITMADVEAYSLGSPDEPTEEEKLTLKIVAGRLERNKLGIPWWAKGVAFNRQRFVGTVFCSGGGEAAVAYLFLYASLNPYSVTFLELQRQPSVVNYHVGTMRAQHRQTYTYLPLTVFREVDLPFREDDELWVIDGVRFQGAELVTYREAEPFETFTLRRDT